MKNKKIILIVCISLIVISGVLIMLFTTNQNNIVKSKTAGKNANSQIQSSTIQTKWNSPEEMDYEILGEKVHLTDYSYAEEQISMKKCFSYSDEHGRTYYFEERTGKLIRIHSDSSVEAKKIYNDKQMEELTKKFIKEQLPDVDLSEYVSELNWTTQPGLSYSITYRKTIQGYPSWDAILVTVQCDGSIDSYIAVLIGRFGNLPKIDEKKLIEKLPKTFKDEYDEGKYKVNPQKKPFLCVNEKAKPSLLFYLIKTYNDDPSSQGEENYLVEIQ